MTPVTLELTDRQRAVIERVAQPGTDEAAAAQEILGIRRDEGTSAADLLAALTDRISEEAALTGYRRAAQNQTSEDRAFARAARRRSTRAVRSQLGDLP